MSAIIIPQLTTVHLVGSLGRAVGRTTWHLDVKSASEAIRAIDINTRGKLAAYLSGPARDRHYRVALQKRDNVIDPQELVHRSGHSTIYIMPTVRGRNSGVGKIVAGIALLALATLGGQGYLGSTAYGLLGGGSAITTAAGYGVVGGFSLLGTAIAGFGVSLLLGGVSQLLAPKPQGDVTPEEQRASTTFPGNTTAVVQGGNIPLVYGRALVSPTPISVTISNNDVTITSAGTVGTVDQTTLEGGGVQYGNGEENP